MNRLISPGAAAQPVYSASAETFAGGRPAAIDLDAYYRAEAIRRPTYLGQLDPAFQAALAHRNRQVVAEDCDFYHTLDMPDGRTIEGVWDLRRHEDAYLGHVALRGQRVIEYGPASGGLTAHMAASGAEIVAFDLPYGSGPELLPHPGIDLQAAQRSGAQSARRLHNSWWYVRNRLRYDAAIVYADIYEPPEDLGRFDIAVFGAILLHLSHPFRALQRAAAITDRTIVVTDVYSAPEGNQIADLQGRVPALVLFGPTPPPIGLVHWWGLSAGAIQHMLALLGFGQSTITTHTPPNMANKPPMFTVVAHRTDGVAPRLVAMPPKAEPQGDGYTDLPLPGGELRFRVAGTEDAQTFIDLGRQGYTALVGALQSAGVDPGRLTSILDFGCGVGRVLRYWSEWPGVAVFGTDISADAIAWDRAHLPFATFGQNSLAPTLDYADGSFDLIYALSVFTHLPVGTQMPWFRELLRVIRPGGCLYFTTHGLRYRGLLSGKDLEAFDADRLVVTGDEQPGSNICAAFHPEAWVRRELIAAEGLEELAFIPKGAKGNPEQDAWLVRKPR